MFNSTKEELREHFLDKRKKISKEERDIANKAIFDNFFSKVILEKDSRVTGYWPVKGEADCIPILKELTKRGHKCFLPHMESSKTPLSFLEWNEETPMAMGKFNIPEPNVTISGVPNVLIVPFLCFDENGSRVGYGDGMYDRTIKELTKDGSPVFVVGIGYEIQRAIYIPADENDMIMDVVITDKDVYI